MQERVCSILPGPGPGHDGAVRNRADMWGGRRAQSAVGLSPGAFLGSHNEEIPPWT